MDSHRTGWPTGQPAVEIRLLGPLTVNRGGSALPLTASRKVRALLAYLAMAPRAVGRSELCELLWDVPNDPRGELRWCLSKIRGLVDDESRRRVETSGDRVRLDLADCRVDAIEVADATQRGLQTLDTARLRALADLFAGDFLQGLEVERNPGFESWLVAQRRRFRGCHAALLEHLVARQPDGEMFGDLDKWLQLAPFDRRVHEALLASLARHGRLREGDEHLAATEKRFEAEGLDSAPIRDAWRAARARVDQRPAETAPAASASIRAPSAAAAPPAPVESPLATRRASIAVMPFVEHGTTMTVPGGAADGLVHDVITRLAKLRSLFVIAQGSVFALRERHVAPEEAGRMLNVDYVASGTLRRSGLRLTVTVELTETRSARILWTDAFDTRADDALLMLDEIGNRIVSAIDREIETVERNRAILRPPSSLNAWEAYHRGLWHMYRFSRPHNEQARQFFETATNLDPTFSRAHAGLSFTHWQNAFQGWTDRQAAIERAYEAAGQSLMADDRDPAAHWAMGRALWLRNRKDEGLSEVETAVELSPNFALGHYALAFMRSQAGDAAAAVRSSDHSRNLSPFDPMLFAMMGARAMALARLGRFDEAADWGLKAVARPNAHAQIMAIASYCLAMADRVELARAQMATLLATYPGYRIDDFLAGMRFDAEGEALFRAAARKISGR